ncbi:MAG TPA: lactose ABC transporter permease, partial [Firmicutes bacterium]|nr:lactose ABC transporter permease [Bacillota bacterium]
MKGKYGLVKIFQYAFLTIAFIIAVFPFYWMVV